MAPNSDPFLGCAIPPANGSYRPEKCSVRVLLTPLSPARTFVEAYIALEIPTPFEWVATFGARQILTRAPAALVRLAKKWAGLKIRSTSIIDTSYCYFGLVLAKRWNIDTAEKELSIFQMLVILAIFTN